MKADLRIVPDFEMIICPPAESFRWNMHDYPYFRAKWHYHPEYELHLTRTTSGVMMVGDYIGEFEPGCLVLTGPNVPHNWVSDIEPGKLIRNRDVLIQFTPEWADRVGSFCPELGTIKPLYEDAVYGVQFLGATALEGRRLLAQVGSAHGAERVVLFLQLMIALARNPAERRRLSRLAPASFQMDLPHELDVAMRYVLEHYSDDIDLASVAKVCGLEPQAFSRFFKRQTGHTFARYVILARIYAACSLLTQTYRPITEICFEVGFNNIANFNRQFFKICGRTPSDYRRNAHKIGTQARSDPFREIRAYSAVAVGEKV
ncbi:AraC family transcriptional regulator protein (plasmid) [Rhizobium etli 8C-3]|uniref:AraC family transcriptional regulator n=2 Tax=Rhizobium TaxID=379 RepID=A0A4R3RX88_9HYPH|nr:MULTISPECIES: AraC family transcriptional regulator [Rhizobium]APO78150.1 AraC family transcriptional regulator protein [Rhizobium etli 8C-3]TCU31104.1 AraC family transcriptional regulator [Rhizobium azibense]TCU40873.1 AraC family transcriptional regulator [Rhizobium azibense]